MDYLFNEKQTLYIVLGFIGAILFLIILKKVFFYYKFKRKYYIFPRISTKGIANIAMVISIAIAILILLTTITAGVMGVVFRAYPGWRINFEGILIKIGGLLFGPIIGMFIGAITDILAVALTAGMFHYGYFICCLLFGLFGGLINNIINLSKGNPFYLMIYCLVFTMLCILGVHLFIQFQPLPYFVFSFLNIDIYIQKWWLYVGFWGLYGLIVSITIIIFIVFKRGYAMQFWYSLLYLFTYKLKMSSFRYKLKMCRNKQIVSQVYLNWFVKNDNKQISLLKKYEAIKEKNINNKSLFFKYFIPILAISVGVESLVQMVVLPIYDKSMSGSVTFAYCFIVRIINVVMVMAFDLLVIFPVYRIVAPSITYNYRDNTSISINEINDKAYAKK